MLEFSQRCIFYGLRQMDNDIYPASLYHTEYFKSPETTDPFNVSIVLPFLECHRVRITQSADLSDWHFHLAMCI